MSVSISGILLDPFGQPASFAEVKFITWQGANDVLTTAPAVFKTSADGAYSFAVEFGTFTVQVRYNQSNGKFQTIKQKVVVNSSVTATTLGELLLFNEPLTPPEIAYVEQLTAECEAYRDECAISAAEAAASAAEAESYLVMINGVLVFQNYALLTAYSPTVLQQGNSFKVSNDPDTSLNGYYSWVSGTTYIKDASLANGVVENGNPDAVSGGAVFDVTQIIEGNLSSLLTAIPATVISGKNLYNQNSPDIILGHYVSSATGIPIANPTYNVTNWMRVEEGQTIYKSADNPVGQWAFYDENRAYISGGSGGTTSLAPAGAKFMRDSLLASTVIAQREVGAETAYEDYEEFLPNVTPVDISRKVDISTGKNKFDGALIIEGFFILFSGTTTVVFGSINASATSSISGYQPVEALTEYTMSGVKNNAGDDVGFYFDADKNVINGGVGFRTNTTISTPADCAFILFTTKYLSTSDYAIIQVELGDTATSYAQFSPIGGYPIDSDTSIAGNWVGKKLLWMGTSIPAGQPTITTPYPTVAQNLLGATVTNVALSGSLLRVSNADGTQNFNMDYHTRNFARTKQEYQDLLEQFGQPGPYVGYPAYSQAQIDSFKLNSYEEKLMTNLDNDLFIFDFSWNDYTCDPSDMMVVPVDITVRDRSTAWGALNYVIDELLAAKPDARILIISHWSDQLIGATTLIQQAGAGYWRCSFLPLYEKLGWSDIINTATTLPVYRTYCVDGVHPHSDTTGFSQEVVGKVCAGHINTIG